MTLNSLQQRRALLLGNAIRTGRTANIRMAPLHRQTWIIRTGLALQPGNVLPTCRMGGGATARAEWTELAGMVQKSF
jgi:hypothetical protein